MTTAETTTKTPAVSTRNLFKTYGRGEATVHALNNVTIDFEQGKFTAIMGPSGSGKSTLMQTLATLDTPDHIPETNIRIGTTELYGQRDNQLTEFRREHVGFIFQAFNLVPTLTAGQNIDLPPGSAVSGAGANTAGGSCISIGCIRSAGGTVGADVAGGRTRQLASTAELRLLSWLCPLPTDHNHDKSLGRQYGKGLGGDRDEPAAP